MEIWDLYDENENIIEGKTQVRGEKIPAGCYHLGVDVWIMNSKGEMLIQKRSPFKEVHPDIWAMTGGSACKGESASEAIIREAEEELGVKLEENNLELVSKERKEHTWMYTYFTQKDVNIGDLKLQKEEVTDAKWASYNEIDEMAEKGEFIKTRWNVIKDFYENKLKGE